MSGQTISTSETRIEALTLQSSSYGVVIPKVYGVCRIPGNLLWYGGFKAVPHTTTQGGKGGGVKTQSTSYTYTASVLMGLCRGPILNVRTVWRGKNKFSTGYFPGQVQTATDVCTVSGGLQYTVANASGFLQVQSVRYTYYDQVTSGVIARQATMANGRDYTVSAAGVLTFAAQFAGKSVSIEYQYATGSPTAPPLGLTLAAGNIGQATWSPLTTFTPTGGAAGDNAVGYSGLAYVAAADYDLGSGAQIENHTFEVQGAMAYHLGSSVPDVDPTKVLLDLLCDSTAGASFPPTMLDIWADWSSFCLANGLLVSPALTEQQRASDIVATMARLTNTGPVWSAGRLLMVPYSDDAASGNGATFTPSLAPVYDLDDDCWLSSGSDAPLRAKSKTPADRYNHVRVEYLDRDNQYNPTIAEAKDQADIDAFGLRSMEIVSAHWVCTVAAARQVAQLLVQRSLNVVSEYYATLPWHFALLEPMDLVTLTDTALGLSRQLVRITTIEESENGDLAMTFEDASAAAAAAVYAAQAPAGYQADYNASPGNADTPVIFEAPADWSSTGVMLLVAARGTTAMWGGCQVWVSLDGSNYRKIGTVYGGARYGTLSAGASGGASTIAVQGLGTQQLLSGSAADAAKLSTLCYVGGSNPEYLAYWTATYTGSSGANAYTLGGLVHAAYGTAAGAHSSGDTFVRVDSDVARSDELDVAYVGQTVYVKLLSFNLTGGGQQGLADVSPYTYTVTGAMAALRPGVSGKGLTLLADSIIFTYPSGGGVSPSSITLTALRKGLLSGTVTWAVVAGTVTLAGSGDTRSIAPASMTTTTATISATITDAVGTYTDYVTITKVVDGAAGLQTATVMIYKRAASAPALPSATATYTFATSALTGLNNGWTTSVPAADGNPLYASAATASATGATDTIAAGEWASAVILAQDGAAGGTAASVFIYQRAASTPSLPSATATYTFATGALTGLNNGWAATVPSGSDPCYVSTATAFSAGATDTIAAGEWAAATVLVQDGAVGPPAAVLSLSADSVTLVADSTGFVASFTGAAATASVILGGTTDDTANWTIGATDSSGVTSSLSGTTVNIVAMSADTGYVTVTASRTGYVTLSKRLTVNKVRGAGTTSGPVSGGYYASDVARSVASHAGVRFETDGTVMAKDSGGTYITIGNWYAPTTTGIGGSYWMYVTPRSGADTLNTGTLNSWIDMSSHFAFTYDQTTVGVKYGVFDYLLSLTSGGATVATGVIEISVEYA